MDSGFVHDGHEVGVALPARNYVDVDVFGDASTCGGSDVHSDIHPVGVKGALEGISHFLDGRPEIH